MRITLKNADLFYRLILRKGFSKIMFCKEVSISQTALSNLISGKRYPSAPVAKKICDTLEVQFDDIFEIVPAERVKKSSNAQ